MFGTRRRREKEKMKLINTYEYVKKSILQQVCEEYGFNKGYYNYEYIHNLYSITYNKETGVAVRIRRTPDKEDTNEIRYELGQHLNRVPISDSTLDYINEIYCYTCPATGRQLDRGSYVVALYEFYGYLDTNKK